MLQYERMLLPKGWTETKINHISELIGGGTPSRKNLEYFGGHIVWLTPTEIPKHKITKMSNSREKITQFGLQKSSAKLIPKDAVLLTSRASIGYIAIAGTQVTTNQGFASFVCNDSTFNYYLAYWLWGNRSLLEENATGTTFKEIPKSKLKELKIPLPPLNEQHRIVSKIESIFAQIDACRKWLEALQAKVQSGPASLAALKSSVLKQAFEGKLVPQDPKDEPAEIMLKKIHKGLEINFKKEFLLQGWIVTTLESIAEITMGRSPPSPTYNKEKTGMPFYQGKADFGDMYPTARIWCDKPQTFAQKHDILMSVRAPVGSTNISAETCSIGRGLAAIRALEAITTMYLFYQLRHLENKISQQGTGTTFKAVTKNQVRTISISVPPLNEQKRIVAKIESIFAKIDAYIIHVLVA